jgi:hypothetical protein
MNPLFAPVANTVSAPEEQMTNQERNPGKPYPYCTVSKTAEAPKDLVDMEVSRSEDHEQTAG